MTEKILNEAICLKQYISEKEYKEISQLEKLCCSRDKTNLKLELDYRLSMTRSSGMGLKNINEFLYYIDDTLAAYLSISSYGDSNIGEINGMTHPDFRRKGLFKKLFGLAVSECQKRSFDKLLLLSDGNSDSGIGFISSVHGEYDFSEYRMKRQDKAALEGANSVRLRNAGKPDGNEITYMIELGETAIGKIAVGYSDSSAFISGFRILPDFRGKGYGKAALGEALRLINEKNIYDIELDVECKNDTALNLYKAYSFEEVSVMDYYKCNW